MWVKNKIRFELFITEKIDKNFVWLGPHSFVFEKCQNHGSICSFDFWRGTFDESIATSLDACAGMDSSSFAYKIERIEHTLDMYNKW